MIVRNILVALALLLSPLGFAKEQITLKTINVPEVSDEIAKNIRVFLAPVIDKPINQISSDFVLNETKQALAAFGYYEPQVQLEWANGAEQLNVIVTLNRQMVWSKVAVTVSGSGKDDIALIQMIANLPVKQGQPVDHSHYESSKKALEDLLLERGYFDFKWQKSQLRVSLKEYRASAVFNLDTAQRYEFGQISISQNSVAKVFALRLAPFVTGDGYDANKLSKYSVRLNETPYFNSVRVYPQIGQRANQQVPVQVEVVDKPDNSFEVGGGFSTDLGAKGRFKWSKPWITEDGHYFETNLSVSEKQQDITTSYTIPVDDPLTDVWRVSTGYKLEDGLVNDNYSEVLTVQLQRQWLTGENWVRTAFVRREKENYRIENDERTTHMTIPGISWAKKQKRGGTLPTWGEERLIAIEAASTDLASSSNMVRIQWKNAWLRSVDRHYFYSRVDLGAIISPNITEVPYSLRFYAGGDQSIRGFKYQSISPLEEGIETGGRYLVTGTLEYQYQFAPKWRAALFVDAGTATNDFSEDISIGPGFGVRYLTPIGPIRFDHAWSLGEGNTSTRLSIVIGPEI
ncbi:membrane protein [Pseudoalteromonas luteoviolacea B = ATCC 29581]|nr:membrane protein [Pseudoalteromonas luteoviolacea B = ATCC 29581]